MPRAPGLFSAVLFFVVAPAGSGHAADKLESYAETIPGTAITIEMIAIPGGRFKMGSPAKEKGRKKDEGPERDVEIRPFWMSKNEISWEAYGVYLDIGMQRVLANDQSDRGKPDAVSYPTPPYADEAFGFGSGNQPTIALTVHAVMEFSRWLSGKTGKSYRLPTEAEWEYACRAGTSTPYSFGAAVSALGSHAWWKSNAGKRPHPIAEKKPNPFGLFDMHGNVAEWVLDVYDEKFYQQAPAGTIPVNLPTRKRFPNVVRGGGWRDGAPALRCAARRFSEPWWSKQDPQSPRSIWWHTEPIDVGFRIVRVADEYPELKGIRSQVTESSP